MIECKKYNPKLIDYSVKIRKSISNPTRIKTRTDEERKIQAEKDKREATEADLIIRWLFTGNKAGLTQYSDIQLEQIKEKIQYFQDLVKRYEIDADNQLELLAFIYTKLHYSTLYKNPLILTGRWENSVENNNIYGGLVEGYTPCSGIATTAELLCKLYGIEARSLEVNNNGVKHKINGVQLENGNYLLFDIAEAIGMTADGKMEGTFAQGNLQEREKYLYKTDIRMKEFGIKNIPKFQDSWMMTENIAIENIDGDEKNEIFSRVVEKINRHRVGSKNKIQVVQPNSMKITPQNILNATRASTRINPGEVSKRVEESRIYIKTGIDKNNSNRNK